jgi:uncharacterized FAD-dependent dehydrogenase
MYILLRNSKSRKINIPEYKCNKCSRSTCCGAGPAGLFAAFTIDRTGVKTNCG